MDEKESLIGGWGVLVLEMVLTSLVFGRPHKIVLCTHLLLPTNCETAKKKKKDYHLELLLIAIYSQIHNI